MTTLSTKMKIGYKFEMTGNGYIKLVCAKGRFIEIHTSNDMYNVKAYNVKGVDVVKVKEVSNVFGGEQLQNAIVSVF
jgi:hypothetical protein